MKINTALMNKLQNAKNKIVALNKIRKPLIEKQKEKDLLELKNEKI